VGRGGGAMAGPPPRPRPQNFKRRRHRVLVIPGINTRKKSKKIVVESLGAVRYSYFLKV